MTTDRRGRDNHAPDAWSAAAAALRALYGATPDFEAWLTSVRAAVDTARAARPAELGAWDRANPQWWLQPTVVGYSTYVDRFGTSFDGVTDRLSYLQGLGVSYLHLLPLMKPRAGESDGGYAIADFEDVNPALGSRAGFRTLLDQARSRNINVVVDLVCNHVADDHHWALAARRGSPLYRDYFHIVDDRAGVERWEASLDEVFPVSAPGNFTWSAEVGAWVWTSFYPYQWDLNYANRNVFLAMTSTLLNLANEGVAGFRLDSTGFLWKQMGTACRNLPQVHQILAAWRALLSIVAPGVVLKAEAIDRLQEVIPYFGSPAEPECDLAYANGVMAGAWTSLALGSAEALRSQVTLAAARPSNGAWINYIRCHDDIILGALRPLVSQADQTRAAIILTRGETGAFGDGEIFQTFDGVPSVNGMAASLCGVARDDLGAARLILLYGVCFALDGLPVIYMGDEFGLANDVGFRDDPLRAAEGRWLQRPAMDWPAALAASASGEATSAGRIALAMKRFARVRGVHPAFRDLAPSQALEDQPEAVLGFTRGKERGEVVVLANFSDGLQSARYPAGGKWRDILTGRKGAGGEVALAPYEAVWLEADA